MSWFTDTFLPSIEATMTDPKYPNQAILSSKQADVCQRYMTSRTLRGDYAPFVVHELETEKSKFQMRSAGRYYFLYKSPKSEAMAIDIANISPDTMTNVIRAVQSLESKSPLLDAVEDAYEAFEKLDARRTKPSELGKILEAIRQEILKSN